jgi:hypothetical protein
MHLSIHPSATFPPISELTHLLHLPTHQSIHPSTFHHSSLRPYIFTPASVDLSIQPTYLQCLHSECKVSVPGIARALISVVDALPSHLWQTCQSAYLRPINVAPPPVGAHVVNTAAETFRMFLKLYLVAVPHLLRLSLPNEQKLHGSQPSH